MHKPGFIYLNNKQGLGQCCEYDHSSDDANLEKGSM